jgi:hypothetical protein
MIIEQVAAESIPFLDTSRIELFDTVLGAFLGPEQGPPDLCLHSRS